MKHNTKTSPRANLSPALIITRREIRDTLRDWRITVPIVLLTLIFPIIMTLVAQLLLDFLTHYRTPVLAAKSLPLLLMVVGFFPISFSLIIALETFVGEKERSSLEPLLATPLTDAQLYLGKTLAAMIPPLLASYLGMTVYLVGLVVTMSYRPPIILVVQIILLTTAEALVMVSGAVVISSQTTSARAANLLASFIILPMAFLVQAEALIMIWGHYWVLWNILLALVVSNLILIRMGVRIFDRDALLGRKVDTLNPKNVWQSFIKYLLGPEKKFSLGRLYRQDLPQILWENRLAVGLVLTSFVIAALIGCGIALRFPLPQDLLKIKGVDSAAYDEFMPTLSAWGFLSHNVQALALATFLAIFSFGSLAVVVPMASITIVGVLATEVAIMGYNPLKFLAVFILPHGILEMPAIIIATAMALKLGACIISPSPNMNVSQAWLRALADWLRVFVFIVLPLLLLAAFIEVHITPKIVVAAYGS